MPYRFVCKDGEEPSGQREETCKVCPDHLTRQKNTPKLAKVVSKRGSEIRARASFHGRCSTGSEAQTSPLNHPLWWVGSSAAVLSTQVPSQREFVQADVLDGGPDDRQATGLRGEHINLIGALPHEAPQTFNRIGGLNVPVHRLRKLVKRQRFLFFLG